MCIALITDTFVRDFSTRTEKDLIIAENAVLRALRVQQRNVDRYETTCDVDYSLLFLTRNRRDLHGLELTKRITINACFK